MDETSLRRFYNDEHMRESVKSFIRFYFDKLALEKVEQREDTKGFADAYEGLENAFIELGELYATKERKEQKAHHR